MPDIEIFRAGTHIAVSGQPVTITEADVVACAAAYDPKAHEAPVCIGHPKLDEPAYGWVKGLAAKGKSLVASVDQVEPQFAAMVGKGLFKKVSASFFPPTHPGNPKPGVWSLRHLGFLGAAPPAVMGLRPVQLAAGDDGLATIELAGAEMSAWTFGRIAGALKSLRDFLLAEFGQVKADQALPGWDVEQLLKDAGRMEEQEHPSAAFAQPSQTETPLTDPTKKPAATAAELEQREKTLQDQQVAFAAQQRQAQLATATSLVETLAREGRVLPAQKPGLAAVLAAVQTMDEVAFAGSAGEVKKRPYELLTELLATIPPQVPLGEVAKAGALEGATVAFAAPEGFQPDQARLEIHNRALAYQAKHPNTDYLTAVKAVGGA